MGLLGRIISKRLQSARIALIFYFMRSCTYPHSCFIISFDRIHKDSKSFREQPQSARKEGTVVPLTRTSPGARQSFSLWPRKSLKDSDELLVVEPISELCYKSPIRLSGPDPPTVQRPMRRDLLERGLMLKPISTD